MLKLKGGSLIESVIALTILVIVLTILSSSFYSIFGSDKQVLMLKARFRSLELMEKAKSEQFPGKQYVSYPSLILHCESKESGVWQGMTEFTVTAFDTHDKELFRIQRIISQKDE